MKSIYASIAGTVGLTALGLCGIIALNQSSSKQMQGADVQAKISANYSAGEIGGFYDSQSNLIKIVIRESYTSPFEHQVSIPSTRVLTPKDKDFAKYSLMLKK
jgi:hypothetical protein